MEEIFEFIEDTGKRLNRPIKDLDDIRIAMKALSEVRENEIRIDMEIGPIEVKKSVNVIWSIGTFSICQQYSILTTFNCIFLSVRIQGFDLNLV